MCISVGRHIHKPNRAMEFKPIAARVLRKPEKVLAQTSRDMAAQAFAIAVEEESTDATLLSWTDTTLFRAALCSAVAEILSGLNILCYLARTTTISLYELLSLLLGQRVQLWS